MDQPWISNTDVGHAVFPLGSYGGPSCGNLDIPLVVSSSTKRKSTVSTVVVVVVVLVIVVVICQGAYFCYNRDENTMLGSKNGSARPRYFNSSK